MAVGEVIALECSDNEDDQHGAAARSAPSATFTWEDMTKCVGQREQFFGNCGPQNEVQNETHCASVQNVFY